MKNMLAPRRKTVERAEEYHPREMRKPVEQGRQQNEIVGFAIGRHMIPDSSRVHIRTTMTLRLLRPNVPYIISTSL